MRKHSAPTDSCYSHASSIQTLPVNQFPSSLEWSNDGQAFAVTRANIYLMTPFLGYLVPPEDLPQNNCQRNPLSSTEHAQYDAPTTPSATSNDPSILAQAQQPSSSTASDARPHQIPMLATMVEVNKQFGHNWSAHSNELHVITPPNDDRFWRTASWSPSGLSNLGSCLLAGLTTTCDVFIFAPCRNFQSGLWEMEQRKKNLSEELLKVFFASYSTIGQINKPHAHEQRQAKGRPETEEPYFDGTTENHESAIKTGLLEVEGEDLGPETGWSESKEAQSKRSRFTTCVLRSQTTALAWSPAYTHPSKSQVQTQGERGFQSHDMAYTSTDHTFDLSCYDVDFSLLALGHRRGDISLWRHTNNGDMELVAFKPICLNGLTLNLLSWSDWSLLRIKIAPTTAGVVAGHNLRKNEYQLAAHLAVASSKGVVYILRVSQPFERQSRSANLAGEGFSSESIKFERSRIHIEICSVYRDQLNLSSITYLKWMSSPENNFSPSLVFTRLGEVVFLQVPQLSKAADGTHDSSTSPHHQIVQLPALHLYDDRLSWANCHNWASCSGVSIVPTTRCCKTQESRNRLIIMLSNGLIFVLNQAHSYKESNPNAVQIDLQHSIQLSLDFRSKFRNITLHQSIQPQQNQSNPGQISKQNVMTVYGSSVLSTAQHARYQHDQFDHQLALGATGSIMSWLYEMDSPNRFCYKPENRQTLHFCMADFNPIEVSVDAVQNQQQHNLLSGDRRRSQLIQSLRAQIKILPVLFAQPTSCIQVSPNLKLLNILSVLHLIFSDLAFVRMPLLSESLTTSLSELLDLLDDYQDGSCDSRMHVDRQQEPNRFDNQLLTHCFNFSKSHLIQNIFYNCYLDRLRLKVNLTSFILTQIDKNQFKNIRTRFVDMKVKISRLIHKEILQTLTACFLKHEARLTDDEKTIMSRYQFASQVIGKMPEPTLEQLLEPDEIDHKLVDQDRLLSSLLLRSSSSSEEENHDSVDQQLPDFFKQEFCPACLQPVHFDSLRFAICKSGHLWDRCSLTFEILSTMRLKTCTNCGRKSLNDRKRRKELSHEDRLEEGRVRVDARPNQKMAVLNRDESCLQFITDDSDGLDEHRLFLSFYLESFVCCPHCGGRWKIVS